jgi:hypothetical protein
MALEDFEQLPRRIFLDSSTLQTLQNYGEFIWENVEIPQTNRIWSVTNGIQNLEALRNIFFVNQRAGFEFALSDNSLSEVSEKRDAHYLQWAYDVLDHWLACLAEAEALSDESLHLAAKLDGKSFGYLGAGDRALIKDAVLLDCDAFLTMEQRLPKNAQHIQRELGIQILTPVQYWDLLRPWARLYA